MKQVERIHDGFTGRATNLRRGDGDSPLEDRHLPFSADTGLVELRRGRLVELLEETVRSLDLAEPMELLHELLDLPRGRRDLGELAHLLDDFPDLIALDGSSDQQAGGVSLAGCEHQSAQVGTPFVDRRIFPGAGPAASFPNSHDSTSSSPGCRSSVDRRSPPGGDGVGPVAGGVVA